MAYYGSVQRWCEYDCYLSRNSVLLEVPTEPLGRLGFKIRNNHNKKSVILYIIIFKFLIINITNLLSKKIEIKPQHFFTKISYTFSIHFKKHSCSLYFKKKNSFEMRFYSFVIVTLYIIYLKRLKIVLVFNNGFHFHYKNCVLHSDFHEN